MIKSKNLIIIISATILLLTLFIFASFYDYQISTCLADLTPGYYYSNNLFAIFFEIFGEVILYAMICCSLAIIYHYINKKINHYAKIVLNFFVAAALVIFNFLCINRTYGYLEKYIFLEINNLKILFFIIFSIFFAFFYIFLFKNFKFNKINRMFYFALFVLCVAIFSTVFVYILKNLIFLRIRFRALIYLNAPELYTPWWLPNGAGIKNQLSWLGLPSDVFKSFPSGHTTSAALSLCFIFYPLFFSNRIKKTEKKCCIILPVLLTFFVAFSRLVAGAHFLTDILFGLIIVIFLESIFSLIFLKLLKFSLKKKHNKT